jgi:hypothetical protein
MKNSNDNIGKQTLDLLACSAVPQPTAPPRTPNFRDESEILCSLMLDKVVKRAVGLELLEGLRCIEVQHLPDYTCYYVITTKLFP